MFKAGQISSTRLPQAGAQPGVRALRQRHCVGEDVCHAVGPSEGDDYRLMLPVEGNEVGQIAQHDIPARGALLSDDPAMPWGPFVASPCGQGVLQVWAEVRRAEPAGVTARPTRRTCAPHAAVLIDKRASALCSGDLQQIPEPYPSMPCGSKPTLVHKRKNSI